jgi:hypothetical protein
MSLNNSGPISLRGTTAGQSIQQELDLSGQISLLDAAVRTLAGVPSGPVTMPGNFYGKSNVFKFNISSDQINVNLRTLAVNAGWDQASSVEATITSGVFIYSNSTSSAALTVSGSFPKGVELINNGTIVGRGGRGGNGQNNTNSGIGGGAGGLALSVSTPISIRNNGNVAGGGGGGQGASIVILFQPGQGGSGGGGGAGGSEGGTAFSIAGGQNGSGGSLTSPGAGGINSTRPTQFSSGGPGGQWGASGGAGSPGTSGVTFGPTPAGAAGAATSGNAFISWIVTGNRFGALN